jgi:hypothetical protein
MIARDRMAAVVLAATLSACASTCGDDDGGPSTVGELGNGRFIYQCVGAGDPVCAPDSVEVDLPGCIAVNARFGLTFDLRDDAAIDDGDFDQFIYVESGNDSFVGGTGPFQALRAGRVAMLAREDEQVVDFIHVNLVVPETLELFESGVNVSGGTLELAPGDVVLLDARVADPDCTVLGGALELDAESSDVGVVSVVDGAPLELVATGRGIATVTVRNGAIEQLVTVTVSTRLEPASEGGTGESGSSGGSDESGTSDGSGGSEGGSESSGSSEGGTGSSGSSGSTGG